MKVAKMMMMNIHSLKQFSPSTADEEERLYQYYKQQASPMNVLQRAKCPLCYETFHNSLYLLNHLDEVHPPNDQSEKTRRHAVHLTGGGYLDVLESERLTDTSSSGYTHDEVRAILRFFRHLIK